MPLAGNQRSFRENSSTMSIASQKVGIETPSRAMIMLIRSPQPFWCTAAVTPRGMPMPKASTMEAMPSVRVLGRRLAISADTGAPVR